jgi:C1A family cysteine protease
LKKLTGTTPPPDLKQQVVKRNALAAVQLKAYPPRVQASVGQNLPTPSLTSFDWRERGRIVQDSGIVTAVQDQATPVSCGCCWAFATVAAVEASYAKNGLRLIGVSEQYFLNCAGDSLGATTNTSWSCNGGWWAFDMLTLNNGIVAAPGAPNRSDLPYSGVQTTCANNLARPWQLTSWGYVTGGGANEIPPDSDLKQALCTYGPLAVAVKADQLTWMGNAGDVIQDFTNDSNASVNHAILLVGWDNSKQAWIFKNSWGQWGIQDSGFGYVGYNCNNIGWGAAWVICAP